MIFTAFAVIAGAAAPAGQPVPAAPPQAGYSTTTLREPVYDFARVAIETVRINNWLNENHAKLDDQRRQMMLERLYYLIDSRVKSDFVSTGRILPPEPDLQLELLFSWSERLGAYGGNLVHSAVKQPNSEAMPPLLPLPPGMKLSMQEDLLRLESVDWNVTFPYYFMIGRLTEFPGPGTLRTQMAIISTGAAKDWTKVGHSQATLMLVYSRDAELAPFRAFWEARIPIAADDERVPLGVRDLTSQRNLDEKLKLHRELVAWKTARGAIAVVYIGNDGTYQWNREHFLDFLRALRVE